MHRVLAHVATSGTVPALRDDVLDPLDAGAAVPPGHDEPDRVAVVERERLAVHARRAEIGWQFLQIQMSIGLETVSW